MKKHTAIQIICLILFLTVTVLTTAQINTSARRASAAAYRPPKIIVDAGHGGVDGGTSSADGAREKDINLAIAKKMKTILNAFGFEVIMIREEDISVHDPGADTVRKKKRTDLYNRLKIIENNPDALFISVHQNHFSQKGVNGTQVFYSPGDPASKELADSIQRSVKNRIQPDNDREVKKSTDDIYVLYYAKTPAVMVECGFLSNPAETARLRNGEYQSKMAFAISAGLMEYLK